jgi:CHAT domain-containing protein
LLGQFESRLFSCHGVAELLIDADDSLSSMPWAVTELSGRRLVEQFALVMTAGFASTSHAPTAIGPASRVAVFANPDVGGLRAEFPPLPDADREAEMIGGFFRSVALRRGAAANREAFLRMAPFADVLHFAGHGVANGGFGGLLVGGEPPFLTAEQIARLDLSRLDLVVLAACSSGLGEETASVNADTLVRGFLDAGAARVLASSWDVSSVSTSRLMRRFYAEMLRGLGPAAALRQAMIALAASGANPYEWAAFQLYGAP